VTRIRVLIADDHAVVRQGLRTFLELQEEIEVVADAPDGEAAVEAAHAERPDVVLMDLVMPRLDGVEATRRIVTELPGTRVLALTSFLEDDKVLPAVRAGATGYLLKDVQPGELVRAIRTIHEGGVLLHPAVTDRVMRELGRPGGSPPAGPGASPLGRSGASPLTPREHEVLELVARGMANKRIAGELGIAEKTVKAHVGSILSKLGVDDRTQAALRAVREGWAELG
jgi:two-component system, NarL family, response regulator LiaR